MVEYASVRSSLYDIDSLVTQLNDRAGEGWEVVQILPTGGDVTAVLKRAPEPSAVTDDGAHGAIAADEAPAVAGGVVAAGTAADVVEAEPPVEETPAPEEAPAAEAVEEPPGWAAEPEAAAESAVETATEAPSEAAAEGGELGTSVYDVASEPPSGAVAVTEAAAADTGETAVTPEAPAAAEPAAAAAAAVAAEPAAPPEPAATTEPTAPPTPPPSSAAPSIPAGWYPDPSTRYELRYWDGSAWTEHVARQGQMYTDPPVA